MMQENSTSLFNGEYQSAIDQNNIPITKIPRKQFENKNFKTHVSAMANRIDLNKKTSIGFGHNKLSARELLQQKTDYVEDSNKHRRYGAIFKNARKSYNIMDL